MVGVYGFVQLARNISPKSQRTEITTVRIEMMESSILPIGKLPFSGLVPRQKAFPLKPKALEILYPSTMMYCFVNILFAQRIYPYSCGR